MCNDRKRKQPPIEEVAGMTSKCPGQDLRNLRVSLHKCPNCGAEVEIFSDEIKVKWDRMDLMDTKVR